MNPNNFSIGEALKFGWQTFKQNVSFLVAVFLIMMGIFSGLGIIQGIIETLISTPAGVVISILLQLAFFFFELLLGIGIVIIALKLTDHERPTYSDLFNGSHFIIPYFIAILLTSIATMVGFFLLIIPGIILSLMFIMVNFVVIDKKTGPIDAIKESIRITSGHKWKLLGFSLLTVLLNILGALALVVGLLVTIPVTFVAQVYIYRQLNPKKASQQPATPTPLPPNTIQSQTQPTKTV